MAVICRISAFVCSDFGPNVDCNLMDLLFLNMGLSHAEITFALGDLLMVSESILNILCKYVRACGSVRSECVCFIYIYIYILIILNAITFNLLLLRIYGKLT